MGLSEFNWFFQSRGRHVKNCPDPCSPIHQSSHALPIGFLSCDPVCQYSKLGIICDLRLNQGPKQGDLLLGHKFFSGPLTSHVSNSVEGQESIHSSFSSGHKMIFVFIDIGGKLKHKKCEENN